MEVIGAIQGVRDLRQQSAFKDYAAQNPDWMMSPEGVEKAVSINPQMAYAGAQLGPTLFDLRMKQAASRAQMIQQGVRIWTDTYRNGVQKPAAPGMDDLGAAAEGAPGAPSIGEAVTDNLQKFGSVGVPIWNDAQAKEDANMAYQRFRTRAGDMYGKDFVGAALPEVMTLDHASNLNKLLNGDGGTPGIMDAFKQQQQVLLTDADGNQRVETVAKLPWEWAGYLRDHAAEKPVLLKEGENIPSVWHSTGGPTAPQMSTTGELRQNPIYDQQQGYRKSYLEAGGSDYATAETAFRNISDALKVKNAVGDLKALVFQAQLENPRIGVNEGNVQVLGQQNRLPAFAQKLWNAMAENADNPGQLSDTTRKELLSSTLDTLERARQKLAPVRAQNIAREQENKWAPGTITGNVPWMSDEELKQYRAAANPAAAAPPAGGGSQASTAGAGGTVVAPSGKKFVIRPKAPEVAGGKPGGGLVLEKNLPY